VEGAETSISLAKSSPDHHRIATVSLFLAGEELRHTGRNVYMGVDANCLI